MFEGTLSPPERLHSIPLKSQWLAGEGAGAWFCIDKTEHENQFRIRRYDYKGHCDCDRIFRLKKNTRFNDEITYEMDYLSHCAEVNVQQNGKKYSFVPVQ